MFPAGVAAIAPPFRAELFPALLSVPFSLCFTLSVLEIALKLRPEADALHSDEIIPLVESYLSGSEETLVQISDDTVVKLGYEFSSSRSEASIAVPRVKRAIHHDHDEGDGLILLDMVQNARQLDSCWLSLSCWAKFKILLTMRYYLQQL
jgi:hypothetical protein